MVIEQYLHISYCFRETNLKNEFVQDLNILAAFFQVDDDLRERVKLEVLCADAGRPISCSLTKVQSLTSL